MSVHREFARSLDQMIEALEGTPIDPNGDWVAQFERAHPDEHPSLSDAARLCRVVLDAYSNASNADSAPGESNSRTAAIVDAEMGALLLDREERLRAHCHAILGA